MENLGSWQWLSIVIALGWVIHKSGVAQRLFGMRRRDDPD